MGGYGKMHVGNLRKVSKTGTARDAYHDFSVTAVNKFVLSSVSESCECFHVHCRALLKDFFYSCTLVGRTELTDSQFSVFFQKCPQKCGDVEMWLLLIKNIIDAFKQQKRD